MKNIFKFGVSFFIGILIIFVPKILNTLFANENILFYVYVYYAIPVIIGLLVIYDAFKNYFK